MPVWRACTPSLTLGYLKSSVIQAGHECIALDFTSQYNPGTLSPMGDLPAEEYIAQHPGIYQTWAKQIRRFQPQVAGFSLCHSNFKTAALVAAEVRRMLPNIFIVSGGSMFTAHEMNHISSALDFSDVVVEGEGEQAIVDLLQALDSGSSPDQVKQLWFKSETGSYNYTGPAPLPDIHQIPIPDYSDFDFEYHQGQLAMLFSRGCVLDCSFCTNKWNHRTQRTRTGESVFAELKQHLNSYPVKSLLFNDDSLISPITYRELESFCDRIIAEGINVPWTIYGTRVEKLLTPEYVRKLQKAGLYQVSIGVESFSSRVQKDMGKSSTFELANRTVRFFADAGIRTGVWIIYGYPTETEEDFEETRRWFLEHPNAVSNVCANPFHPNQKYLNSRPGTLVEGHPHWAWKSNESTLLTRKLRFLRLIEVLEWQRQRDPDNFSYQIADPIDIKYFNRWNQEEKDFILDLWEEMAPSPCLSNQS
ncbi:MAG: radical SAM protein [Candidatus Omnitrophica bacterium]|nr:radical SAM protein [Candidatus Omnitrophota bacterium]